MNKNWKNYRKKLMAQPGFKEGYESLKTSPEFAIYDALEMAAVTNLTQAEIAKGMGTKQSSVARLKSGLTNPTIKFLEKFAKAINMNLSIQFTPKT